MKTKQSIILLLYILLNAIFVSADEWKFLTEGSVNSSPIIDGSTLFVGSDDTFLYAFNIETGDVIWDYETAGVVKSTPLVIGNNVFITSACKLYALNKSNGELIWEFSPEELSTKDATNYIDDWDYHSSSPFEYNGTIYYGDDFGNIHGVAIETGASVFKYTLAEPTFIRTTVNIVNDTLYFGDWNGHIYAIDILLEEELWHYSTFESRPYDSFGGIVTQPIIYKGKLYVGARNYDFSVLTITDGKLAWKYNDTGGGWITGTPLIVKDTLYQGGSDNKQMIAFNAETGHEYWKYNTNKNIFCKPFYSNGLVLFTDGDSYNHIKGKGHLYAIKSNDGSKVNDLEISGNSFSSPLLHNGFLYFGSYDNYVNCVNFESFISSQTSSIHDAFDMEIKVYPNPASKEIKCEFTINEPAWVKIVFSSIGGKTISTNDYFISKTGNQVFDINTIGASNAGSYILSLLLNNEVVGSSQVVIE